MITDREHRAVFMMPAGHSRTHNNQNRPLQDFAELPNTDPVMSLSPSFFFFSSRRRHTRFDCDWSSDVCSSDLNLLAAGLTYSSVGERNQAVIGGRKYRWTKGASDLGVALPGPAIAVWSGDYPDRKSVV